MLARDKYLCQPCLRKGRYTQATQVDHIESLALGGTDEVSNLQAICDGCHKVKTAVEGKGVSTHPEWLPKPGCRVVLVSGPPGAGKTTYCKGRAGGDDVVIDLDDCFEAVCGTFGHALTMRERQKWLPHALRYRNKLIADLAQKHSGTAYVIVAAPLRSRVEWWMRKLNAEHVLIDPGLDACLSRLKGHEVRESGARLWYQRRTYTTSLEVAPE